MPDCWGMPAARVLIDGPSELVFDYAIPAGLVVQPGCRVRVPLRHKAATGTVLALVEPLEMDFALRPLTELIDPEPLVTPTLMRLGSWVAEYYHAPLEQVMRSLLPESVRQEAHSGKSRRIAVLVGAPAPEVLEKLAKRAPRQHALVTALEAAGGRLPAIELGAAAAASLKALERAGVVRIEEEAVRRDPDADQTFVESHELTLNSDQAAALDAVLAAVAEAATGAVPAPMLLQGVTGSGKTEVYLQAVRKVVDAGKSAIILVPEISLTPQTVQRFKSRFADIQDQVAVLHSHLSQGERFDEWHRIRSGAARIVIGARSAIFAPLPDPGIIIVDEEHENSYKQENPPRYHGRDLAVLRASMEPCAVLLGSATPSLESYQHCLTGKYRRLVLPQRADHQALPLIRIVDMRLEAAKHKGGMPILSDRLRSAIEGKLEKQDQVILFLNRRGFARSLQCPSCGHVCECTHCAVPLTYHRSEERLICHICGFQAITPRTCPACRDPAIRLQGYGTEKVEEVLRKVFPKAAIARIDTDTMRRKNALRDTLAAFQTRKLDILIGTQMIAKGLHFPNVTLVGVLNADLGLHVPDFRAGERTFQLLTQVAGRAGRGELEGEVFIQTFTPHSPSIQFARHHDFEGYADQEMEFRRQFGYPPFLHVALLTTKSAHERRAEFTLQTLHRRLLEEPPAGLLIGEPLPSPLVRAHGQFRFQLMLRCPRPRALLRHLQAVLAKTPLPDDVTLVTDMDALNFS
jgi:primosomal protein N' (replication factor Y)